MKYIKKPSNQFIKEYKLPLGASFAFVVVLLVLLSNRTINRIAIADVLGKNSDNDYSKLLSSDKNDEFKKNDTPNEPVAPETISAPTITNQTFSVAPNPSPSPPPTQTDPGQTVPPPTPPQPFSANILAVEFIGSGYVDCNGGEAPPPTNCFKKYLYRAKYRTVNGPGIVNFRWDGNPDTIDSSGSFSAPSGENYTFELKEFKLPCTATYTFKLKFIISSPNYSESAEQSQDHYCDR